MPGSGYQLNRLETQNIQDIIQGAGAGVDPSFLFSLLQGTVGGAQDRRAEKVDQRQQLQAQFQQQAMEMAGMGASEDAVASALTGMAAGTPLARGNRGDERVAGLESFVGGLYDQGPVSGLAPADYRAQFDTGVVDEEDRAAVGGIVLENMQKGMSFRDIRNVVRQQAVATGQDEMMTQELLAAAEESYEALIGTTLEEMRGTGDVLRSYGYDTNVDSNALAGLVGMEQGDLAGPQIGPEAGIESFMASLVNDPRAYAAFRALKPQAQPSSSGGAAGPMGAGYGNPFQSLASLFG